MTSPSPTRPRTTPLATTPEPRGRARAAAAAWALAVAVASAAPVAAGWRDLEQGEPPVLLRQPGSPDDALQLAAAPGGAAVTPDLVVPVAEGDSDAADSAESTGESERCLVTAEDCREALAALRKDTLTTIDIDIRVTGTAGLNYPCECRLDGESFEARRFAATTFTWKAAGYCHKPLYFEHWNLERYGHSHGFVADSFLSAAHFFARLPALPYQMGVELPWECVYPLGYYRPGSCAPWTVPAVPVSARGLAVGAATATGLVFLLP